MGGGGGAKPQGLQQGSHGIGEDMESGGKRGDGGVGGGGSHDSGRIKAHTESRGSILGGKGLDEPD